MLVHVTLFKRQLSVRRCVCVCVLGLPLVTVTVNIFHTCAVCATCQWKFQPPTADNFQTSLDLLEEKLLDFEQTLGKKHWLADERWKSVWHMVNLRKLGLLVQLILWDTRNVAVKSDNMTVNSYYYFVAWLIFNYRNTASSDSPNA